MIKVFKRLTEDQIERDVIFSSCLSVWRTEQEEDTIHEVKREQEDNQETIKRLKDDKFFNDSHWNFNIIREGQNG